MITNQQRLGTGLRINSAADDAAGLQIATRLNAQSRGMGVAMRNTSDATSMLQTAEGAFSEMTDILQRMKDLATQGANGTNSADDLKSLQAEYAELGSELGNIMKNTKYAGDSLLYHKDSAAVVTTGKLGAAVKLQIGADKAEQMTVDVSAKLTALDTQLALVSDGYTGKATAAAGAHIFWGGADATITTDDENNANAMIETINTALNKVGDVRAQFGSTINRLNHVNNNLANMKDNTEMAKGRIMDADFAVESANMSKNSMLMQSGISMLKQAGQMPGMVMGLLG